MIQITPAILTDKIETFESELLKLNTFESIDIDIIKPPYINNTTLSLDQVLPFIRGTSLINYGFHLMELDPIDDFLKIVEAEIIMPRIYLQQETHIDSYLKFDTKAKFIKGISVEINTQLQSLAFYDLFDDVQFMSIEIGKQGNSFQESIIEKVKALRALGYKKKISLDGGINLETAKIVSILPINRVSVGSYFAKSSDLSKSFTDLNTILNPNS